MDDYGMIYGYCLRCSVFAKHDNGIFDGKYWTEKDSAHVRYSFLVYSRRPMAMIEATCILVCIIVNLSTQLIVLSGGKD